MSVAAPLERLRSGEAVIGVIGLGYVGLPLCRAFVRAGYRVLGFDIDSEKVALLERGSSYVDAVPDEDLARMRAAERFSATSEEARAAECDALVVCVPTPLTPHREPDTSYIERTLDAVAPHLRKGALVVLESTTYPGTTAELVAPRLAERTGRVPGEGFLVAYSPERENPGSEWTTDRIPKVVGADDPRSLEAARALYERAVVRVVAVSSTRAAEATKLLENVYRCVNIAVVNELKVCFERMGIDVFEVIDAARTKPFGFMPFWPGPGVGGHCIPIDPVYLAWKVKEFGARANFIELASEVNGAMPRYVVERCVLALNDQRKALRGARVLVLGVSYKKDLGDVRESPAIEIIGLLRERGAQVAYHDPHVPRLGRGRAYRLDLESVELTPERLASSDLALVVTDHGAVDYRLVVEHAPLVVDSRNATREVRGDATHVYLA